MLPFVEPNHEVLVPELLGHWGGPPHQPGAPADIDMVADAVERDMDAAGWDTAHVAGTSLGGLTGLVLAKRGRARTCTAMATVAGWPKGGDLGLRLVAASYGLFNTVTKSMARNPGRWTRRPRLRRLLYWHHFARTDRMDPTDTAYLIVGMSRTTILPALFEWARTHDPPDLTGIPCPVQILFPEKDHVFPRSRYGEGLLEAVPNAEVHELPGVGHVPMWDDPEQLARYILDFTSRARARGPEAARPAG
jgi:pimeloyl-ACP methyl ester carboxylesterase